MMDEKTITRLSKEFSLPRRLVSEALKPRLLLGADEAGARQILAYIQRAQGCVPLLRHLIVSLPKNVRSRLIETAGMSRPEAWAYGRWLAHFRRLRDVTSPPPADSDRRLPLRIVMNELGIFYKIKKPSLYLRQAVKRLRRKAYVCARNEYEALFAPVPVSRPGRAPATAAPATAENGGQPDEYRPPLGGRPR